MPPDMEVVTGASETGTGAPGGSAFYLVRRLPVVTGRDLRNARVVARREQPAGRQLHAQHRRRAASSARSPAKTSAGSSRSCSTVACSRRRASNRASRLTGGSRGSFTQEEVQNLSLILRSGALPATLTYLEERTIGPSLGADSIRSGVIASVVGLLLSSASCSSTTGCPA